MKADKEQIYELVIEPLKAGYSPRHNADRDPVKFGELVDMLVQDIFVNAFSVNALKYGMTEFRQDWTYARWPVFGELKTYLAIGEKRAGETAPKIEKKTADPIRWADHIMRTPNGRTAIESGHALSLYEWAEANPGKTPGSEDMAEVVAVTKRFAENMKTLRASTNGLDRNLLRIGEGMEKKRVRIEVYYGQPAQAAE